MQPVPPPVTGRLGFRPLWSQNVAGKPRGLSLAREKGWLLGWDDQHHLYLWNQVGRLQGQMRVPGELTAACAADDGSALAAVGRSGQVWLLAPDLSLTRQLAVPAPATALALDPFGHYLAVADSKARLHVLDRDGRRLHEAQTARPLHHLAFVPAAPFLVGCADYGLVVCFDLVKGTWAWQDGLVAHVGSLTVNGDGSQILLACFGEGLRRYSIGERQQGRVAIREACRLASLSFDGTRILAVDLANRLLLVDSEGQIRESYALDQPAVAAVLAALADGAAVLLADGTVRMLELREAPGT